MNPHAAHVPLLTAFDTEYHLRKLRREMRDALEEKVAEDVRTFHALQRAQEEGFYQQFRRRFPEAKDARHNYKSALDAVVHLEFAHALVGELLPQHIGGYEQADEKGAPVRPFAIGAMRPFTDAFFAVQSTPQAVEPSLDMMRAAHEYRRISKLSATRYQDLLRLNNVGDPAVEVLRQALSGVGADIHYLGAAIMEDKARYDERLKRERTGGEARQRAAAYNAL